MKTKYTAPSIEVIEIELEDILLYTGSGSDNTEDFTLGSTLG